MFHVKRENIQAVLPENIEHPCHDHLELGQRMYFPEQPEHYAGPEIEPEKTLPHNRPQLSRAYAPRRIGYPVVRVVVPRDGV